MRSTDFEKFYSFGKYYSSASFLPLDEAIASRAVLVVVSGSDVRADGRKRFWSQLNNSKRYERETICVNRELIGKHGRATERAHPGPHVPQTEGS